MQVVVIPAWLEKKLQANGLPLKVVLDTERLSSILSKEDLFFLLEANDEGDKHGDMKPILDDFRHRGWISDLLGAMPNIEYQILYEQHRNITNLYEKHCLVYGDVFDTEAGVGTDKVKGVNYNLFNYDTEMLDKEIAAVIIRPCTQSRYATAPLSAFLEVVKGQMGFDRVVKLKSFNHFVQKVN